MSLFSKMAKAMENRDASTWNEIYHDDFQFVRHQSGTTMNSEEMKAMVEGMMANDAVVQHNLRCVYENDDILVEHSVMDFPDGTQEAIMAVHMLKDGKIIHTETGATRLK